jgi:hypothetical protein
VPGLQARTRRGCANVAQAPKLSDSEVLSKEIVGVFLGIDTLVSVLNRKPPKRYAFHVLLTETGAEFLQLASV